MNRLYLVVFLFITLTALAAPATAAAVTGVSAAEAPDIMEERVKPCIVCHGLEDKKGRDAYYPRIAGKPEGYLFNQLRNFRDGRRHYRPMALLLDGLPDRYLREMAAYFASLEQAFPPPEPMKVAPTEAELARKLIRRGDAVRNIPACTECHGKDLMGIAPFIPGLLGLPRVYIMAQFGNWQHGALMRGQTPDCMSRIAKQLTTDEAVAIAAWLAAQPVPAHPGPASTLAPDLAKRCSSIILQAGEP